MNMQKISKYLAIVPANCLSGPCHLCDFVTLVDNLVKFALFALILPVCVIAFITAGIFLLTAAGSPEKIEKGKKIFWYAFWGLILAFAAFLIVHIILATLIDPGYLKFENGIGFPGC